MCWQEKKDQPEICPYVKIIQHFINDIANNNEYMYP